MIFHILISIAFTTAVVLLIRSYYERKTPEINEYTVYSEKLPESFDDTTWVFLSDLHDAEFGEGNETLIRMIQDVSPEAVFVGGDMTSSHLKTNHAPFKAFQEILEAFPDKMFYVINGNHESRIYSESRFEAWRKNGNEILSKPNVCFLKDSFNRICLKDDFITVGGMELEEPYYKKKGTVLPLEEGYVEKHLGKAPGSFNLILCHSPLYIKDLIRWGADLVLSGHFHGGTIRLPILGGVMTPQYQFFSPYTKGVIREGEGYGIVSGGLGTHSINIRLNNKPDIVKIRLKKGKIHES